MNFTRDFFYKGLLLCSFSLLFCLQLPAFAESITVAGTGDSQYLLRQLAQDFEEKHPGTKILVPNSVGSGGGIKLLLAGRTELARIARPLKPKEQAEGLQHKLFAYSPIVFVANLPETCVQNLSTAQVIDIHLGKLNNWNQFKGCPQNKIYVAVREDGDSSRLVLEENIPELTKIKKPAGKTIYSTPETYDTLSQYQFSFGYLPKTQIPQNNLTQFAFDGVAPSRENIQQGRYKLVVPLSIVWKGEPKGLTKQFLDYLFTPEAQALMTGLNTVPAGPE